MTDAHPIARRSIRRALAGLVRRFNYGPAAAGQAPSDPRPDAAGGPPLGASLALPDGTLLRALVDVDPDALDHLLDQARPLRLSTPPRRIARIGPLRLYADWRSGR